MPGYLKDTSTTLGVVVNGMGIAGKVRVRDLSSLEKFHHPELGGIQLIGYVSRRDVEVEGATKLDWAEALKRDDVHIVIICTENCTHVQLARDALEAGKHVLIEFPLALNANDGRALTELAESKGLLCYEEDIAMLSEKHEWLKEQCDSRLKGLLTDAHQQLRAKLHQWIAERSQAGSLFHSWITFLHQYLDLFGDLEAKSASFEQEEKNVRAKAVLTVKGIPSSEVKMTIERRDDPDVQRQSQFCFKFKDGTVVDNDTKFTSQKEPSGQEQKPGLFLRDFIEFLQYLRGSKDPKYVQWLTIRALEIADELDRLSTQ